jgi:hypothetical protein
MIKTTFIKAPLVKNNISPIVYHIDGGNFDIESKLRGISHNSMMLDIKDYYLNKCDLWERTRDRVYGDEDE